MLLAVQAREYDASVLWTAAPIELFKVVFALLMERSANNASILVAPNMSRRLVFAVLMALLASAVNTKAVPRSLFKVEDASLMVPKNEPALLTTVRNKLFLVACARSIMIKPSKIPTHR